LGWRGGGKQIGLCERGEEADLRAGLSEPAQEGEEADEKEREREMEKEECIKIGPSLGRGFLITFLFK
jgi:hypothetical protein